MMLMSTCRRVLSKHQQQVRRCLSSSSMLLQGGDVSLTSSSNKEDSFKSFNKKLFSVTASSASRNSPIFQHCAGQRSFVTSTKPLQDDDLPYHLVVGMPALSPTMESGILAEWSVAEGGEFSAGDVLAEIQTDKASVAFEAQDDGYIAKYLVEPGTECQVGDPIMVTVEEEEYIGAFKDFVAPAKADAAPTAEAPAPSPPTPEPKPVSEDKASPPAKVEAAPAAAAAPPKPATPPPAPPSPPTPAPAAAPPAAADAKPITLGPSWGSFARTASPLAKHMSASQKAYIDLYGSTGQQPI